MDRADFFWPKENLCKHEAVLRMIDEQMDAWVVFVYRSTWMLVKMEANFVCMP